MISAGLFGQGTAGEAALTSLLRAAATALPFLALMLLYEWWRGRRGLGMGDVKLAAVAGVWLDWFTIVAVIEVCGACSARGLRHMAFRAAPADRCDDAVALRPVPRAGNLGGLDRRNDLLGALN